MRKIKSLKKTLVIGGLALLIGGAGIMSDKITDNYFEISKNLEIFTTLFRELNIYYVDETNPGELMKTAIDAMLESLDPYTNFIPEADMEDYRFMTTGQYGGIGSLIRTVDGDVHISEPYEGFPAQKSGLRAGDKLLQVDGVNLKDRDQEEVSKLLKGQAGSTVKIKIERPGEPKPMEISVLREEIKIPDVPYYGKLNDEVGYIKLTSFTHTAGKNVRDAFLDLRDKQNMSGLILDLRGNGGGLLREAVNIVNFFVPRGKEVVSTRGKITDWDKVHKALNEPIDTIMPIIVLVDESSASASEIVSGALQDYDRAVVIGRNTFGKGLVQQTRDLFYNSKLKLTVAKYYIPSGRCIQRIDYTHKKIDGGVDQIPDSLLHEFHTKGGRVVIDGRGIEPDILVEEERLHKILLTLLEKQLFFKYATKYFMEHDEIVPASEFTFTDEEYDAFAEYVLSFDVSYTTSTEKDFERLLATAKEEEYYQNASEEFAKLKEKIKPYGRTDLYTFRRDIQMVMENEIVSRYYYQTGRIEATLAKDRAIERAKEVLDNGSYSNILSINYTKK
jgi:carboxyl-terminal processing protease